MILMRCVEDAHHVVQCHGSSGFMLVLSFLSVMMFVTFFWCGCLMFAVDRLETAMKKLER